MSHISNPSKFIRLFLLGAASFVAFSQAQAQDFKVAFFNGQRVLDESAPAKIASSRIEQEFSKRKKDLDDVNDRFRTAYRKYEKDAPTLSEGERLRRQRELAEMDQDFNRKQRIYNEDLAQRRQEEAIALGERALKIVRQIAEAEKIDIVVQAVVKNPYMALLESKWK